MEQRLSETHGQLASVADSMEQRLSETHGQLASVVDSVGYLLGRVEFVRRELMFEMRYGSSAPTGNGDQIKAKTEILSPEKLAAARCERLQLNLGCGHIPLEGYLNVDRRALPGVDIVSEVGDLPFQQGEVDEIFSAHLLEHFPQEQLRRELLPYFFDLLKEGGAFRAVVPDAEAMIREYSNGRYPYDDMREVMYGAQDYDGDFHFNMFTPQALSTLLLEAGFKNPVLIESGRKNGRCYEFEIQVTKT
jgi:predicted SAM-dependent methyltransferase